MAQPKKPGAPKRTTIYLTTRHRNLLRQLARESKNPQAGVTGVIARFCERELRRRAK